MSERTQSNTPGKRSGWHPGMAEPDADDALAGEAAASGEHESGPPSAGASHGSAKRPANAERVQMPPLEGVASGAGSEAKLDVILDIPVTLTMELGRARIPIRTLMQLNQGSVVELERMAGEPLDVLVNGMLIAHGEVVVINERFGIRFTDVVSPAERAQTLR